MLQPYPFFKVVNLKSRKIYLLDRNVVNLIKDYQAGKLASNNDNKSKMLQELKSIDCAESYISPLLSIIEGEKGRLDSKEEKNACLRKETLCVSKFFENAKTDEKFLLQESLTGSIHAKMEEDWHNCNAFLLKAIPELKFNANKKEALEIKNLLKDIASSCHVGFSDPVFICALSCLYGGRDANAILKPERRKTKDNIEHAAYNSINDINTIHRVLLIKEKAMNLGCEFVKFLTLDEGLKNFIDRVYINQKNKTIAYDKYLFPKLSENEYNELMISLGAKCPDA